MSIFTGLIGKVTGLGMPWKILGVLAILGGVFAYGYHKASVSVAAKYELKISKFESAASKLSAQLAAAQSLIEEKVLIKYQTRVQVIEKERIVYQNQATQDVPAQNVLSNGWIYLHNQAALGLPADDNKAKDPTPSGVMDNQALGTVTDNYGICKENAEQLKALQDYNSQLLDYSSTLKAQLEKANKSLLHR